MSSQDKVNAVASALAELEVKNPVTHENGRHVSFSNHLDVPGVNTLKLIIDVGENRVTVIGKFPIQADSENIDSIRAASEFVCRANYGLLYGHFNLDPNDGEITYQTTLVDVNGASATSSEIIHTLIVTLRAFEQYGQGFLSVIYGGALPKDACARCEQDN